MVLIVLATTGVKFGSSVLTRRDLQHSGSGLGLNWLNVMCPDRHPSISQFRSYLTTKFTKLGANVAWQGFQEVTPWAGVAMRGFVLVRGFDSSPFRPILGPGGSIRTHFTILGVSHLGPHYFLYYIPISPVWLCCAVYLFLSPRGRPGQP